MAKKEAEDRLTSIKAIRKEHGWLTFAEVAIAVPVVMFSMHLGLPTAVCYGAGIIVAAIAIWNYKQNKKN